MRYASIALVFLLTACNGTSENTIAPAGSSWRCTVAVETGTKLGGCAIGDVDPRYPGNEIVAVGSDGAVHVVHRDGERWVDEVVYRADGEMIQCAVGQFDATPWLEIAACGMVEGSENSGGAGIVHVLSYDAAGGGSWRQLEDISDLALVHGVCFHDGAVLSVGFSRAIHRSTRSGFSPLGQTPGHGKQIISTGDGAVIACDDGWVGRLRVTGDTGAVSEIDRRDVGRARLGAAGDWIAVADDDGTLSLIRDGKREAVYRSPAKSKLRGAVVADLDPTVDGRELATAGYDGKVVMLTRGPDGWTPREVGHDSDKLHHLTAGDLDADGTPELVAVGYSGRILVISVQEN